MYKFSFNDKLVSTTFAAKMLNLSVGTVQRLIDQGKINACKTPGGHRRIDLTSLSEFDEKIKKSMNIPINFKRNCNMIAIITSKKSIDNDYNLTKINQHGLFKIINHPLELSGIADRIDHIFIDSCVDGIDFDNIKNMNLQAQIIVYNSQFLPKETRKMISKIVILLDSELTMEFLLGYQIALQHICLEH